MVGTYADVVIADAIVKNITSFDWSTARDALMKDSFQQPPGYVGNAVGKLGLEEYTSLGYVVIAITSSIHLSIYPSMAVSWTSLQKTLQRISRGNLLLQSRGPLGR